MKFIADKQTLEDLNLLGKTRSGSIFRLFNKVKTRGGELLLEEMFHNPLTEVEAIKSRVELFKYFTDKKLVFPMGSADLEVMEDYLRSSERKNYLLNIGSIAYKKVLKDFLRDQAYTSLYQGLLTTIKVLNTYRDFLTIIQNDGDNIYQLEQQKVKAIFADSRLGLVKLEKNNEDIGLLRIASYDFLFKHTFSEEMGIILESLYKLDMLIAVGGVARENGFAYAEALPKGDHIFKTSALWHPGILNGVTNSLVMNNERNMIFLTGANMAGKSTLMKSIGIAFYLAHMGFPVAAKDMEFSVRDGLYSSINVSDNLNLGYSHFYAEVLRVKTVAQEVANRKDLMILFDELFKGTNVKDAYDGTLAVTAAFAMYWNCFFVVSTHIVEVGEALLERVEDIQFTYLPTIMEGNVPKYTYKLQEGITSDRQGMIIIENEGILDMMKE